MRALFIELWYFFLANLRASYFGAFLLAIFLLTEIVTVPYISRYDFIFLMAIGFQICALVFRFERLKEFFVIILFHILATGMELFKTHPAIGSWTYPGLGHAVFVLATVPLFTGFLYSAIGSYISRAFIFLRLSYERFPAYYHLWILVILIYVNFFTHHFLYDIRYILFAYTFIIFFKTKVHFQVYQKERTMPFLLTAILTALFVWIAENIGTFTQIWLYPSQLQYWHFVSFNKMGSWFLLLILSFALVSIIYREKLKRITKDIYDKKHQEYQDQIQTLEIEMSEHSKADYDYQTTVATVISVARRAKTIFDNSSEPARKRAFLNYILQNPTVDGKKLEFTIASPFNLVLELADNPNWLSLVDDVITYFRGTNEYFFIPKLSADMVELH